eukprot:6026685-Pyramimonas_sp.AAC.1
MPRAGFRGFRWFCDGKRDVPTPKISGRPGLSVVGFLWKVSCGLASTAALLLPPTGRQVGQGADRLSLIHI